MNWKTTLIGTVAGIVGAVVGAIVPLMQGGVIDWKLIGTAALVAALGYFAKDSNVTGGTVKQ
jgi:hypothetical protein